MSKILKNCNDKKAKLDSVYKPDGTLTETPEETLEIMEKSLFKDGDPPAHTNTNTSPDKHLSQIIYSESRMQEAISSFDPLKAAGPDTLQPLTIQKAWHHIHKTVRNIMIKSHEMQHVPGSWTESNVVCKIPLLARRTRPKGQARRATIGYLVYKIKWYLPSKTGQNRLQQA